MGRKPQKLRTTLPETNSLPLKMDGWNTSFLLGPFLFVRGKLLVSGRVHGNQLNAYFLLAFMSYPMTDPKVTFVYLKLHEWLIFY